MAKNTVTYWNALDKSNDDKWEVIEGTKGLLEQLTLAIDMENGDYPRLTRFKAGADTKAFGAKGHNYPEEIIILKGRLYDKAFNKWLTRRRLRPTRGTVCIPVEDLCLT